jgi:predicted ATPase/class 3 adenylate cyclase
MSPPLPTGTVTFLFTDIEGSTRLLERAPEAYPALLEAHRRLLDEAIMGGGGVAFGNEGDAVFAAFARPTGAIAAAAAGQRALAAHPWPEGMAIRVRMGLHTGEAAVAGGDYVGLEVHRAARIAAAAHGGQVLVSGATRALAEGELPGGVSLRDLGEHRLKDLSRPERISQLVIDGLLAEFPPPRTLDATPNNLPTQLTSFIGRETEIATARGLLEAARLLTFTGPGGTGKTRLSLALAADVADGFPDGVTFVPLEPITDPDLVASAIAGALGLYDGQRPPLERLVDHLRERRALLVLDNFEQVLGAGGLVTELLRATAHLKVIVTSRAVLRVSGEQEFPVPPLPLPTVTYTGTAESLTAFDAVRLFLERALAVRPDFTVTNENAPAVAGIVARLDGLPLAIELAAARVRILGPSAIFERLGDRLSLLSGGGRDLPARQQTLRGAIDWSYDLLDEHERRLFARFGIFMGGAALETAEAVCGPAADLGMDVLDGLGSLVEKSLLRSVEDDHGDTRFTMLETIRAYASERLAGSGEEATLRERHARALLSLAQRAADELEGPARKVWLDRLADDHDNIRAALGWFIERGDAEGAGELVARLWRFWHTRGHLGEGRARVEQVLALPGWPADRPTARLRALEAAGGVAYWQGDLLAAHRFYAEAAGIARGTGDKRELANALYNLFFAPPEVASWDDWRTGISHNAGVMDEVLALYGELDDDRGMARALWGHGEYALFGGDMPVAERRFTESLEVSRRLGDAFGQSWSQYTLGVVHHVMGRPEEAARDYEAALDRFREAGDLSGIGFALIGFARLGLTTGERDRAYRLAGAAQALTATTGAGLATMRVDAFGIEDIDPDPADPALAQAYAEGRTLTMEQAIALALAPVGTEV